MIRGWVRWLLRRPCEICGDRRRCSRWHVEFFHCPTCGTEVSEFDTKRRDRVVDALLSDGEDQRPWWYSFDFTTQKVEKVYGNGMVSNGRPSEGE